ncbi:MULTISPECIES: hypothetical protein [unclassified Streptomyces]
MAGIVGALAIALVPLARRLGRSGGPGTVRPAPARTGSGGSARP